MNEINPNSISVSSLTKNSPTWPGIDRLQSACLGMILLDIETNFPVEEHLFTPREAARATRMGLRRRMAFTAARVALKRLARQLDLVEKDRSEAPGLSSSFCLTKV